MHFFGFSRNKKQFAGFVALFVVVLLLSILSQLPANWVLSKPFIKQAIEQKINPSQKLKILASRGTIWQGEVDLAIEKHVANNAKSASAISIGKIAWDLNLASLLITKLSADIDWQLGQSTLSAEVSTGIFSSMETRNLHVSDVNGVINLKDLMPKLAFKKVAESPITQNLAGLVGINHVEAEYLLQARWFSALESDFQIDELSVMNNVFPTLNLKANLQEERIKARLNGQKTGWQLNGTASLNKSYAYHLDLNLKATSEKELPDWAFLLQKKSAVNYVTKLQGRLF
ncbi:type II secretion system protein N [Thiomicrorhabdus sp. Kp2]|uniref:type II secretion system protein N n=1 Tax=Thiomicrorhabdus sp. Kp2 TaxID=1123518 RepID=UPI0003F819E9|nr:type II secretion system protein N [Thiomicrorhabdus sp. Kp2]